MTPFPFFVGCDRSGTSLLMAMFNSHPELAITYETHSIPALAAQKHLIEQSSGFDVHAFAQAVIEEKRFTGFGRSLEEVKAALQAQPPSCLSDALRTLYRRFASDRDKSRYADKTPRYVLSIPPLAELFPEAVFVHIVRDGRAVALSLRDVEWGPTSIGDCARFWKKRVVAWRSAARSLGPGRCLEVRYEELVTNPEETARQVCRFIELDWRPEVLDYVKGAQDVIDSSPVPHRHQGLLRPPRAGFRDYTREMRPRDIALFERSAGDALQQFGYELTGDQLPTRARLAGAGLHFGHEIATMARNHGKGLTKRLVHR